MEDRFVTLPTGRELEAVLLPSAQLEAASLIKRSIERLLQILWIDSNLASYVPNIAFRTWRSFSSGSEIIMRDRHATNLSGLTRTQPSSDISLLSAQSK